MGQIKFPLRLTGDKSIQLVCSRLRFKNSHKVLKESIVICLFPVYLFDCSGSVLNILHTSIFSRPICTSRRQLIAIKDAK